MSKPPSDTEGRVRLRSLARRTIAASLMPRIFTSDIVGDLPGDMMGQQRNPQTRQLQGRQVGSVM